jgi:hypothetical protein
MCMVLFAWATNQQFFKDMTDTDFRKKLMEDRDKLITDDILPFGFIEDGMPDENVVEINNDEIIDYWFGSDSPNKEDALW